MRLVTFTHAGSTRIGVQVDDQVVDLAAAAPELPREMCAFLAAGQRALDAARAATENGRARLGAYEVRSGADPVATRSRRAQLRRPRARPGAAQGADDLQ
jgi:hypothetical protein